MRILHLLTDWWLSDCVVSIFKPLDFENEFVCFCNPKDVGEPFKVLKCKDDVKRIAIGSEEYNALLVPSRWDLVWTHGLHDNKVAFLRSLDSKTKIMWSTWGFDYLDSQTQWMYGPRTMLYWMRRNSIRMVLKVLVEWVAVQLQLVKYLPRAINSVFPRVNFFSSVIPNEEPFIRKLLGKEPKWLPFHCIRREVSVKEYPIVNLNSRRMIVGNSAYDTCNHFDAFQLVRFASEYEIWSPLSYTLTGVHKSTYAEDVIRRGKSLFGERFHSITEMMPFDEYVKWLSTCAVYVYPNKRQQALGNISLALRMGGCVFLDPHNPIYQYYKENGVLVYPLREIRKLKMILSDFRSRQMENIEKVNALRAHGRIIAEIDETIRYLCSEIERK